MGCRAGWDFTLPPRDLEGCAVAAVHPSSRFVEERIIVRPVRPVNEIENRSHL